MVSLGVMPNNLILSISVRSCCTLRRFSSRPRSRKVSVSTTTRLCEARIARGRRKASVRHHEGRPQYDTTKEGLSTTPRRKGWRGRAAREEEKERTFEVLVGVVTVARDDRFARADGVHAGFVLGHVIVLVVRESPGVEVLLRQDEESGMQLELGESYEDAVRRTMYSCGGGEKLVKGLKEATMEEGGAP
jgi:hypothetical protein